MYTNIFHIIKSTFILFWLILFILVLQVFFFPHLLYWRSPGWKRKEAFILKSVLTVFLFYRELHPSCFLVKSRLTAPRRPVRPLSSAAWSDLQDLQASGFSPRRRVKLIYCSLIQSFNDSVFVRIPGGVHSIKQTETRSILFSINYTILFLFKVLNINIRITYGLNLFIHMYTCLSVN